MLYHGWNPPWGFTLHLQTPNYHSRNGEIVRLVFGVEVHACFKGWITDLDSGTPNVQSLYHFFAHRTGVWGQKGLEFCLDIQQNQGTNCVMWHMKQSIWSTDFERPVTNKSQLPWSPDLSFAIIKRKFLGRKYRNFPAGFWDLIYTSVFQLLNTEMSFGLLASTIEHNSLYQALQVLGIFRDFSMSLVLVLGPRLIFCLYDTHMIIYIYIPDFENGMKVIWARYCLLSSYQRRLGSLLRPVY